MKPRKPTDLALLGLCCGIVLLMPPFVLIFNKPLMVLGIPLAVFYVFGVWLALVISAVVFSSLLSSDDT